MAETASRHPEAAEFIRWLYERTGVATVGEFAELVGEPERKIYRWLAGENAPRFDSAMKMMRAAGVLDTDAPIPQTLSAELAALRETLDQRLGDLDARLETVGREQPPRRRPAATRPAGGASG